MKYFDTGRVITNRINSSSSTSTSTSSSSSSAGIWSSLRHDEDRVQEEVHNEVGVCCFAKGKVERDGEHFRGTLTPKASTEWPRIVETEKVRA